MASTIQEKQNQPANLKLLAAQRQLYSEAKRSMAFRLVVSVMLLCYPLASAFIPAIANIEIWVVIVGIGFIVVTYLYLKPKEQGIVETAAKIQEEFDIAVLDIPTAGSVSEHQQHGVDIDAAARRQLARFGLNPDKKFENITEAEWDKIELLNWYAVPANIPPARAALFCQKSNLLWDYRQRQFYMNLFLFLSLTISIVPLVIACMSDMSAMNYVKKLLALTSPFLFLCFDNYRSHHEIVTQQEQKSFSINSHLESGQDVSADMLRFTQNAIYENRKKHALVPDFLYKHLRELFEGRMKTDADIQQ